MHESHVEDVKLPIEFVELTGKGLRMTDGSPFVVRVEYVAEEVIVEATESLPGEAPQMGLAVEPDKVKTAKQLVKLAPKLIEASCVLLRKDGSEVRPAFYFGEDPGTGALPGKFLSFGDKLRLVLTLLNLCGFTGGAATKVTFRNEVGGEGEGGAPPVDIGGGSRRTTRRADARKKASA